MTNIPHWLREIFLESGQKLWLVDEVTVFFSAIVNEWQKKGRKRQRKHGESTPKTVIISGIYSSLKEACEFYCWSLVHNTAQDFIYNTMLFTALRFC